MNQAIKVSEIQIMPVKPRDGLIGFASFVLDNRYYVGSVGIFTRLNSSGYRLTFPTKKVGEQNINLFHPITAEAGQTIERAITEKVSELFNESYDGATE